MSEVSPNQRANRIARVFVAAAVLLLLSSCDLFRAVASPPTNTPAATPIIQSIGTLPAQQGLPLEGLADSLAVGSASLLYWSPANGNLALAGDDAVRVMPLPQQGVQAQSLDAAPIQPLAANTPTLLTGAQSAPRLAWVDAVNQVFSLDPLIEAQAALVAQEEDPITGLALSPDGNNLALATTENKLRIFPQGDQFSAQAVQEFPLPAWLTHLSYSPDGKLIGGTDLREFTVYILDAQNGSVARTLEWFDSPSASLYGAFFAPDWSQIAWVAQASVQMMNVTDGSKGPLLSHQDHVQAVAWSTNGTRLATASVIHEDSGPQVVVLVWDPRTGSVVSTIPQPSAVRSLAFSPDGKQIAAIDSQQNLQVWNIER